MGAVLGEIPQRCEALLQGRRTYQVSAGAWPERGGDPFADWINAAQKYVVTDSLTEDDLTWNPTTIIRVDDLVARQLPPLVPAPADRRRLPDPCGSFASGSVRA